MQCEYTKWNKKQRGHKGVSSQSWPLTDILKLLWKKRKRGAATAEGTECARLE